MPDQEISANAFAGRWSFSAERSTLSSPAPASWVQHITVNDGVLHVEEKIARGDGTLTVQIVEARIDGTPYSVRGSPVIDAIAYTALGECSLQGVGTRNGTPLLHETVHVAPDGSSLTLEFKIDVQGQTVASGTAVFLPETSSR
jgi:hypothetical protein